MPLDRGTRFGRYEIIALIGSGGMGEVYRARDTKLGRVVALKVLAESLGDAGARRRFLTEAQTASSLNHPHIVTVHDVGDFGGQQYLITEFVDGGTLKDWAGENRRTQREIVLIMLGIADAIAAAHEAGILHRDIKPANILINKKGIAKLADFGLAKFWDPGVDSDLSDTLTIDATEPGQVLGTIAYMSPEQAAGQKVDARSDIFSFGVVLFELLAGKRPFAGRSNLETLRAILGDARAPLLADVPQNLKSVVANCLEKSPAQRYQNMREVVGDLERITAQVEQPATRARLFKYTVAVLGVVVIAGAIVFGIHRHPKLTDKDVVVLADFTNNTGDTAFDGALRQALAFELERSPFLKVLEEDEFRQTLQLMGRPTGQRITNEVAREVCIRDGQKATVEGSISSLGKAYQIGLRATNCQTGETIAREQAQAQDKEHVLNSLATAANDLRASLGESLTTIKKSDLHAVTQATTNSLEALKAFDQGRSLASQGLSRDAIPEFQRAINADPNFAMAYELLGVAYGNSGEATRQKENYRKAFTLRDRVSERERLFIEGQYYRYTDLSKAIEAYQMDARSYPRYALAYNGLFTAYTARGEYEKALEAEQQAVLVEPRAATFRGFLMTAYIRLDRFEDAKRVALQAGKDGFDGVQIHQALLWIGCMEDDGAAQAKEIQWFKGKREEYLMTSFRALNAWVHGKRRESEMLYQLSSDIAGRQGATDIQLPPSAVLDASFGKCKGAGKNQPRFVQTFCADSIALRRSDEMNRDKNPNPDETSLVYVRALAALVEHQGAVADTEFEKITSHKGRYWGPYYPASYLGLARAAALKGDNAKAKNAYAKLLALWNDADPDLPFVQAARKEYAALK